MAKYKKKTNKRKVEILEKALELSGERVHRIAVAMGYVYSDLYDEPTWFYSK
jgi:hypothetical protein